MWKDIAGFKGLYQINDHGDVLSLKRIINDSKNHVYVLKERILKPNSLPNGYQMVTLMKDNVKYPEYIHRLVANAFIPNPFNLLTVNHIDGNKKNNNVNNLEWATYSKNNQHAYDTGLHQKGEGHYKSKLTRDEVKEIRQFGKYATYQYIAQKYNVSKATIRDILQNKTWKNI